MNKPILIPLFATSVLLGCQNADSQKTINDVSDKDKKVAVDQKMVAQWVGHYHGTTPCMGCTSRCEGCAGMAVDLELKDNMTYVLQRESLSDESAIEKQEGAFMFKDKKQIQLELLNVKNRNQLHLNIADQSLEIQQDTTAKSYDAYNDFLLTKWVQRG
ncbi:hypothetical protein B9T31_05245 [Acinetobacter sp. ANC 4558]|uniref:copper resistance protein NlpE N-terminal domain-containing protein n=1 Tax=Acinetobacter sp. ANC 4558 TaxID=1977876 RepID=UPI000A353439|nr:copper resistance protein NlpE N-terminal domain-containing protein [Acinetobacter sp. ANC 4558]OTG87015.1 hypothetical protein B9T31_05245 [Acinetobacter sp. ANC 4558]